MGSNRRSTLEPMFATGSSRSVPIDFCAAPARFYWLNFSCVSSDTKESSEYFVFVGLNNSTQKGREEIVHACVLSTLYSLLPHLHSHTHSHICTYLLSILTCTRVYTCSHTHTHAYTTHVHMCIYILMSTFTLIHFCYISSLVPESEFMCHLSKSPSSS